MPIRAVVEIAIGFGIGIGSKMSCWHRFSIAISISIPIWDQNRHDNRKSRSKFNASSRFRTHTGEEIMVQLQSKKNNKNGK